MKINLNSKCERALKVWDENLLDAMRNFNRYREINMQ